MAWNWQNALSGAASGAGTGALAGSVIPGLGTGIGALGGGLGGFFLGGFGGDPYQQLGDPSDVTNVNQYTDPFWQQLTGQGQNTWNQMQTGMGSLTGMINALDPLAAQNYFNQSGGGADQMRAIAQQNLAQYDTNRRAVADRMSQQAVDNISGHFGDAGPGALRSGAAGQAISEGAINPILQANTDIANMMAQQSGQLQSQNMNNLFNSYLQNSQMGLGAQTAQNQMLAGMYGQQLGQMGGLAGNEWWQPAYAPNPGYMSPQDIFSMGSDVSGLFIPQMNF
jgi:hypothetical protein